MMKEPICLQNLLAAQAALTPEALAVVSEAGGLTVEDLLMAEAESPAAAVGEV